MLVDTHCHLDAAAFAADRSAVIRRAREAGVCGIVIPAVGADNFAAVRALAHATPGVGYALGIHPLMAPQTQKADIARLRSALAAARDDPRLVAVGEIGLDFFVPALVTPAMRAHQDWLYRAQLDLAHEFGLPVLLHVRRAQDALLKALRPRARIGGIAHAFNGSTQQAQQFIDQGFVLGLGGAMTFERARRIRRLARTLPLSAFVLETDAPDIPPAWLGREGIRGHRKARNEPAEVAGVARAFAQLRGRPVDEVIGRCTDNALRVLPRLRAVLSTAGVSGPR